MYETLEQQIADAMVEDMTTEQMAEVCYIDSLRMLDDCTEDELLEYERDYLKGEKHE